MAGDSSEDRHKHKRKRSSGDHDPSDSGSDDLTSSDNEDERRREKKHKKKHKKEKKHKKHISAEEKALMKEAKKVLKAHLKQSTASEQAPVTQADVVQIAPDDYFEKNPEFTAWLLESRNKYFNELKTEESRELFEDFVEVWNAGRLASKFYQGLVAAPAKRTTHTWNFKGGLDTQSKSKNALGMSAFLEDEQERKQGQRQHERQEIRSERAAWNRDQRLVLDELLPKATGRDAVVEKRIARRQEAKEREASPDVVRLPGGGDVLGGGDSFAAAKARLAQQQEWGARKAMARKEEVAGKLAVAQAAEDAKMASFRALAASGPITIPKR